MRECVPALTGDPQDRARLARNPDQLTLPLDGPLASPADKSCWWRMRARHW